MRCGYVNPLAIHNFKPARFRAELNPAPTVAAEAGGEASLLHRVYGDALLAHSVCAHTTKITLGAAGELLLKSQAMARATSRGSCTQRRGGGCSLGGSGTALQLAGLASDLASGKPDPPSPAASQAAATASSRGYKAHGAGGTTQPSKLGGHSQTTLQKQSPVVLSPRGPGPGREGRVMQKEVPLSRASLSIPSLELLGLIQGLCQGQCWAAATRGTIGDVSGW